MPRSLGAVISGKLASPVELDTMLGIEDLYTLLEILTIDSYNQYIANKQD